jgi:DNA-nicking Smr family endonuclease
MSGKRRKPGHRRGLSQDDLAVWRHVAKSVKPMAARPEAENPSPDGAPGENIDDLERAFLDRLTQAQGGAEDRAVGRLALKTKHAEVPEAPSAKPKADEKTSAPSPGRAASTPRPRRAGAPPAAQAASQAPTHNGGSSQIDAKLSRKIRRGQVEIDARLDLHGMTQATAHAALRRFIVRCAAQNRRTVLVITGKGRESRDEQDGDWWADMGREPSGILRRSISGWLADPALRPLIVGFEPAAPHHGGGGAFYIRLKRRG